MILKAEETAGRHERTSVRSMDHNPIRPGRFLRVACFSDARLPSSANASRRYRLQKDRSGKKKFSLPTNPVSRCQQVDHLNESLCV